MTPLSAFSSRCFALVLFGSLCAPLTSALAADDNIADRVAQTRGIGTLNLTPQESLLTGRDDLVVLRKRDLFQLSADFRETYTDNAFLTDRLKRDDFVFDGGLTARVGTRIAQRYDIFAETSLFTSQYTNHHELSYNGFGGRIGGSTELEGFQLGLTYSGTAVYDHRGFDKHSITLHTLTFAVSHPFVLCEDAALVPQIAFDRTLADPDAYNTWTARAALQGVYRFLPTLTGTLGTEIAYRTYDDYFERITLTARKDQTVRVAGGLRWKPVDYVQLAAEVGFGASGSTLKANDYTAFSATPSLNLNIRF